DRLLADAPEQLVKVLAAELCLGGGLRDVALVAIHQRSDVRAIEAQNDLVLRVLVRDARCSAWVARADRRRLARRGTQVEHEIGESRRRVPRLLRERDGARERVPELADVARPTVRGEAREVLALDEVALGELRLE